MGAKILPKWVVALGAAMGLALRFYVLSSPLGEIDGDEAVSALVSREVLDGRFTALIPGLKAGGTILAYPRAVVIALFGPSTDAAKLCEVAVFALACVAVWRLGARLFSELHGQVAGLLMWVYPAATVWDSTKVRLYYTPALLFVALAMLFAVRIHDAERARYPDLAAFGALAGLCVWTHPMAMYAFVPTALWLFARRPRLLRFTPLFAVAAIATALPWLVYNARHDWGSLRQPLPPLESTIGQRFEGFFRGLLPRLTGFRHFYNGPWFLRPWSYVAFAALGVLAVVGLARWRGNRTLLLAVAIGYPLLFSIPRNSVFVAEPRYGVPFVPTLAVCAAALVVWAARSRAAVIAGVLVVATALTALSLHRVAETSGINLVLSPPPTEPVWETVAEQRLDRIYGDYWLAYRMVYEDRRDMLIIPLAYDYYGIGGRNQDGAAVAYLYRDSRCLNGWLEVLSGMGIAPAIRPFGDYVEVRTPQPIPVPVIAAAMNTRC